IQGVFYDPTPADGDEIAVFTFDSINVPAGVTVKGAQNEHSRPIALLSQGSIAIEGIVDVSGGSGGNFNGDAEANSAGAGGQAGPGGGGGGGGGAGSGVKFHADRGLVIGSLGAGGAGYISGGVGQPATSLGGNDGPGGDGGSVGTTGG